MSQFNLNRMFEPAAIAVVGASDRPGSIGRALMENLAAGGYQGRVYPINVKKTEVMGQKAYPSLSGVGQPIDLVVIVTAIRLAPSIINECGRLGIGAAIIISGGGKEAGAEGAELEERILAQARAGGVRIMGPNCIGLVSSRARMNASFAHLMPLPGKLAFVSQSGATCCAVLDFAVTQNIGFSHFVSIGSSLDVDFGDVIDYLGNDPDTEAILLYVESVTNHRKFMSAARAVSRVKPIILLKVGRSRAGALAAMSHTGALAGEDAVYDAAFKRAGLVRVDTVSDLFDCAELMAKQPRPKGPGLAIISNAGGPGVMAADHLALSGIEPAELKPDTLARLDEFLPPMWSRSNPLDILGDASPETFRRVVDVCMTAEEFDAVLVMTAPQAQYPSTDKARLLSESLQGADFPVFTSWIGGKEVAESREIFRRANIPTYDTPERAVRAFLYMYSYDRNLKALQEVPRALNRNLTFDREAGRRIVDEALTGGRTTLTETESKELLTAYGIPVTRTVRVKTADEAMATAVEMGFPVVVKIDSKDISHKTEAGGVQLNLRTAEGVRQAWHSVLANAREYDPEAVIKGVTVQPMATEGWELIMGVKKDADFGPVLLFGMGGTAAEVIDDTAIGLPPLNRLLARRMIAATKVSRLLDGFRGRPPVKMELVEEILVRLSQLVTDLPEVAELDINPLVANEHGLLGLDARVCLEPSDSPSPLHLAISPYPEGYRSEVTSPGGVELLIRPIKPEDGPPMIDLFHALSPRSVFWRFGRRLEDMPPDLLARYTQIDYDREMALVAFDRSADQPTIVSAGRVMGLPDSKVARMGVSVADAWQGRGVGREMISRLVAIAKERGFTSLVGRVDRDNEAMLRATARFKAETRPIDGGARLEVTLDLRRI